MTINYLPQRLLITVLFFSMASIAAAQQPAASTADTARAASDFEYEYMIISGGMGAGVVVSTNIINTGAVVPFSADFMLQSRHNRFGLGFTHELYLTPQNLGKMMLGESSNVNKFYLKYEWTLLRHSPVNFGVSGQFGLFTVGREADLELDDHTRLFGNLGVVGELGFPRLFLFARPALEYKSYTRLHKEVLVTVSVGVRYKMLSETEKARREARRRR